MSTTETVSPERSVKTTKDLQAVDPRTSTAHPIPEPRDSSAAPTRVDRAHSFRVAHLTSVHVWNDPRIFHKQCKTLAQAGFDVQLIASVDEEMHEGGVRIVPLGSWKTRWQRWFRTVPKLFRVAWKARADVYHLHDPELLLIAQLLRMSGARVVYDIHEDYVTSLRQKKYLPVILRHPLAWGFSLIERFLSVGCARIIAEKYYEERFPTAQKVLNYPIREEHESGDQGRIELDLDPRYKWYLYTGNVAYDRGALTHLNLLRANPLAGIVYVGKCPGSIGEHIRSEAQRHAIALERIHIVGEDAYVPKEQIHWATTSMPWVAGLALFPETDHYKRKELTKFFEYMEAGLPVLASSFPTWEKMIHDQIGFTVDTDDFVELRILSQELENSPELRSRFSETGLERVCRSFNWQEQGRLLVGLYERILDGSKSRVATR